MEDVSQAVDFLIQETQCKFIIASTSLDIEIQEELSKILNALRRIKTLLAISKLKNEKVTQSMVEALVPNIKIAISTLQGLPNKVLAKRLRRDV